MRLHDTITFIWLKISLRGFITKIQPANIMDWNIYIKIV